MFSIINKYKISILWTISLIVLFGSILIAQFKPFNQVASAVIIFISFGSALLAMIFMNLKRNNKDSRIKVVIYAILIGILFLERIFLQMVFFPSSEG
ncbi:hypothetical protein [Clostridium hydrogeniformans]|uniref:hypothetical protein n=1 Tax=Clostridium hydrogeniformans TaxID=349933 RepID=UPI000488D984|nr:hypothetical protein [Clostridium hydrogeniformans]